jgi:hypothetical protein
MTSNRYLHIAVIFATLLFLVLWQTAVAGPPEKPGNPGVPGLLAEISELNYSLARKQETIDMLLEQIEELKNKFQNFAPIPQTGQTIPYYKGDDGDLQLGVPWPEPRFTDNGDGTVKDHLTGLFWLKNANCFGSRIWYEAVDACNNLADGACGLSDGSMPGDWHLPNIRELHSLIDMRNDGPALPSGHPFTGVESLVQSYWSSTTVAYPSSYAWIMYMNDGSLLAYDWGYKYQDSHVWPVRCNN